MIKNLFIILIIASFLAVAVFGALAMNMDMNHEDGHGCLAATVSGGNCPATNPWNSFLSHFAIYKSFSTAIFVSFSFLGFIFLATVLTAFLTIFIFYGRSGPPLLKKISRLFGQILCREAKLNRKKIFTWLALRENSPAIF